MILVTCSSDNEIESRGREDAPIVRGREDARSVRGRADASGSLSVRTEEEKLESTVDAEGRRDARAFVTLCRVVV